MRKGDKGNNVFGVILILAIIVSVFGGVVLAGDVSGGLKQSVDDAQLFDKNKITDQQKQQEILNMVNSHRGSLPAELILAIIRSEGGEGAFHVDGWNYNPFYRESDGPWAQPTNGDGIMQVTTASGYHELSGPYTHDWAGYDHAINDGCDYLLALYNTYGTHVQSTLHYNTGPNSLYIYLGKNWGDKDYLSHVAGHLSTFVPNTYALQNQNIVNALNQGQDILDIYLDDMGITTGQSVGYYEPYQTQLDSELHNISVTSLVPLTVEMNVPVYKQGYPSPWYNDQLGTCSETIGSAGCAITSIAMVFKYYGVQTDPRDMNNWLKQNNGYTSGCFVDWPVAAGRSGGTVQWAGRINFADLNRINSELNNGYPVIAEVRYPPSSGNQHFVVITGYSGATYNINDPLFGDKSTINGRYGNPASAIHGIRLYHGTAADTPIPLSGDLNGDGTDSYGTFDPSTAGFTFNGKTVNFGTSTDLPVMGDWDHDGKDEIGLYRPDDGGQSKFYLITRDWASLSGPAGAADKTIPFGSYPDNIPIAGDWDGDGDDDIGGYYSGTFTFYLYLLNFGSSTATSHVDVPFGDPGDIPLIGDWDNDGDDDVAVCRKNDIEDNPTYYFDLDLTGVDPEIGPYQWGNNEDIPITGRWNAGSGDKIGVYRPSTEGFHFSYDIPQIQPDIRQPISAISFSDVTVGNSPDKTTIIYNDGSAVLTVNSITWSSGSSDFTYIGPSTPFNIAAGGSGTIIVRFAPSSTGSKSANFNVNSNDPDEANVPFSVSGYGTPQVGEGTPVAYLKKGAYGATDHDLFIYTAPTTIGEHGAYTASDYWSPDGSTVGIAAIGMDEIAYLKKGAYGVTDYDLFIYTAPTTIGEHGTLLAADYWSPDGSTVGITAIGGGNKIAYLKKGAYGATDYDLYIYTAPTTIGQHGTLIASDFWAPDGNTVGIAAIGVDKIAYLKKGAYGADDYDLYVYSVPTAIGEHGTLIAADYWAPDGNTVGITAIDGVDKIAYLKKGAYGADDYDLYVYTAPTTIGEHGTLIAADYWAPDGQTEGISALG